MDCVNVELCGGEVDPTHPLTFWEAKCYVRDRDGGGPNRRSLTRTGRGLCLSCSTALEYDLPQSTTLFPDGERSS